MVNGLGQGLIKKEDGWYYNANYKGYPFILKCEDADIEATETILYLYEEYDDEENGIGEPIEEIPEEFASVKDIDVSEQKVYDHFKYTKTSTQEYIDWCFEKLLQISTPTLISNTVKNDIDGNLAGEQWDYEGDTFIYDNYEVFTKRAIVWANANLSEEQIDGLISSKEVEGVVETDTKKDKIDKFVNAFGLDCGLYQKAITTPDGKIMVKV